jgi:hypothetical protein
LKAGSASWIEAKRQATLHQANVYPAYRNVKLQWPFKDRAPPEPHFVVRDPDLSEIELDAMLALFRAGMTEEERAEQERTPTPQQVRLMSDMELTIGMLDPLSVPACRA